MSKKYSYCIKSYFDERLYFLLTKTFLMIDMSSTPFNYQTWVRKRKLTTVAFAVHCLFIGCDWGIFTVNLWLYITDLVKPSHPKLFYSLISMAFLVSSAASAVFICKYADSSRRIRRVMVLSTGAMILGNLIYTIPFTPLTLLVGRILASSGKG